MRVHALTPRAPLCCHTRYARRGCDALPFRRYDVKPEDLGDALRSDTRVKGYALFIAEPGAAEWMSKELPLGQGHVCLDIDSLPATFREVFTNAAAAADTD